MPAPEEDRTLKDEKIRRLKKVGAKLAALAGMAAYRAARSIQARVGEEVVDTAKELGNRVAVRTAELRQKATVTAEETADAVKEFLKTVTNPHARFADDVGRKYDALRNQGFNKKEAMRALSEYFEEILKQVTKKQKRGKAAKNGRKESE